MTEPTIKLENFLPERERFSSAPKAFRTAFIKAINEAHVNLETLIQASIDQQFLGTAFGRFLIQLGEQEGFAMPANSGLDINAYKTLVPIMVADPKQIREVINSIIQGFYFSERTRPSVTSTVGGPYSLSIGDDLIVVTEKGTISISLAEGQVADFSNITALEIASIINSNQSIIFADSALDRTTGKQYLRISGSSLGQGAVIRIAGGKMQNVLQFPQLIDTQAENGTTWKLKKTSSPSDLLRFTWDGLGTNPNVYLVHKDDVVTIRGLVDGSKEFSLLNGSYSVVDSGYDYFVVKSPEFKVAVFYSVSAMVSIGSPTVTVTAPNHGMITGDGVSVVASASIGGIPYADLTVTDVPVSVIDSNTFSYTAASSASSTASGSLNSVTNVSSTLTQNSDNNIIFTKNKLFTLYDKDEYAFTSESESETVTATVPAVPPLVIRSLKGAAHLHGYEYPVIDITRTSLQAELSTSSEKPIGDNFFVLSSRHRRYNFRQKNFKTSTVNANITDPTYQVEATNDDYSVLPYTVSTLISTDPLYVNLETDTITLTFPYRHGLEYGWGFTLSGATGSSNISSLILNNEHVVLQKVDDYTIKFKTYDTSGNPIKYNGISWGSADAYQVSTIRTDGADFYLQFSSSAAAIASGLLPNMIFDFGVAGTDIVPVIANKLRQRHVYVTVVDDDKVYFNAGIGTGAGGLIISAVNGNRSSSFGGSVSYYFDKTSDHNVNRVLADLKVLFVGYTQPKNPNYIGSYLFDPAGITSKVTVSKYIVGLTQEILRGDNIPSLFVDSDTVGDEKFPTSGTLLLEYGTENMEGPIKYTALIANPGSNQIIIDPAYRFKKTHKIGAKVQYLDSTQPLTPGIDGADYPSYVTGSAEARKTLFSLIDLLVATGIFVEKEIIFPDLRYVDTAIQPYE